MQLGYAEQRINSVWHNENSTYDWECDKVEAASGKFELDLSMNNIK